MMAGKAQPDPLTVSLCFCPLPGIARSEGEWAGVWGLVWGSRAGWVLWVPLPMTTEVLRRVLSLWTSVITSVPLCAGGTTVPGSRGGLGWERWKAFDQGLTVLLFLQGPPGPRGRPGPPVGTRAQCPQELQGRRRSSFE